MPTETVLPHVVYRDVPRAAAWLSKHFGFAERYRYGEPVSGAQMVLGNACIMLHEERRDSVSPSQIGWRGTQSLTVFVEDVEAHYERTKAAGAVIVEEVHETCYGELQYGTEDLDGHHWRFSRHARDVSPEEWGATIAEK